MILCTSDHWMPFPLRFYLFSYFSTFKNYDWHFYFILKKEKRKKLLTSTWRQHFKDCETKENIANRPRIKNQGRRMSVISMTCPQTTLCYSSKPPHRFLTDFENSQFPRTSIPASALKLSPYSQRLLGNRYWVSRRNRFHANSADSDADTNELETQLSRENGAVSSNGGNPSTSFLSVLCPLLKLFSVSLSYPLLSRFFFPVVIYVF